MKKLTISFLVVGFAGFMLYRYSNLIGGACDKSGKNKFECESVASTIANEEEQCKNACPTQPQWTKYCNEKEDRCKNDCALLLYEGKTQDHVNVCTKLCVEQKSKDLAAYKDKDQCEDDCSAASAADLAALEQQYSK